MKIADRHPRENGRDYAMRVIRDGIISLELEPGSVISDRELATEMNLSRTPVREALLELAKVKIVEIYPQRGISLRRRSLSGACWRRRWYRLSARKRLRMT